MGGTSRFGRRGRRLIRRKRCRWMLGRRRCCWRRVRALEPWIVALARTLPTLAMLATICICATPLLPERYAPIQRTTGQPQFTTLSLAILLAQSTKVSFSVMASLEVDGAASLSIAGRRGRWRWSGSRWSGAGWIDWWWSRRIPRGRRRWGGRSWAFVTHILQAPSISRSIDLGTLIPLTTILPIIGAIHPFCQTWWRTTNDG